MSISFSGSLVSGLFDTHIHFFDQRYEQIPDWNWSQAIANANKKRVQFFCNVGTNLTTSQQALSLAKLHNGVFAACGFHPTMVNQWENNSSTKLLELLKHPKTIAIGEIGLDFYHQYTTPELQEKIFHQQLLLAQTTKKPVLLHIRQAYPQTLAIVKKYDVKGIVHCFSGTLAEAQEFIQLGFFISFSGVLTFSNATNLQNVAKVLPLDKIVLETDGPYLAPMPFRGKPNLPEYLLFTAQKLATLKNISLDEVIKKTTINAFTALKITSFLS